MNPAENRSNREVSSTVFSTAQTAPASPPIVTTIKTITTSESQHAKTQRNITYLTRKVSAGINVGTDHTQGERRSAQGTVNSESPKKSEDYDYDYMSLPPSLPNLR